MEKGVHEGPARHYAACEEWAQDRLALELKSPGWDGEASYHQKVFLTKLEANGWQVMCSNCYEDLIFAIRDYMEPPRGRKRERS